MKIEKFIAVFKDLAAHNRLHLNGRIVGLRDIGKLSFIDLMQDHHTVQVTISGMASAKRGDIIEVHGAPKPTRDGLPGLIADSFRVLQKCTVTHFPDRKMGLAEGSSQRSVDLLCNEHSHKVFRSRAAVMKRLTTFLDERDFLQVETPTLSANANGANARPFHTKSVQGSDYFLRIAPELHLKRLVVGGFDRVYEVGKVFRNEGIDSTHQPEFTSLELYQAYSRFESDLVPLVKSIFGLFHDYRDISIKQTVDIQQVLRNDGIHLDYANEEELTKQLVHYTGLAEPKGLPNYKLFERLLEHHVEPLCTVPTILIGHPVFTSPLAAASQQNALIADRLEVFIDGKEVANGYQELADPFEQQRRFKQQAVSRNEGDLDSPVPDAQFVDALRLGMPPTVGLGIGIDRLVMVLLQQKSLKSVILFPQS